MHHLNTQEDIPRAKFKNHGTIDKKDFPNFMTGYYADNDLVVMRDAFGPLSRTVRTINQDAISQAIEKPDRGGISWIGHRAFDRMRTALEEHLDNIDKHGNRSHQISWIKNPTAKAWINSMKPATWLNHLDSRSKVAKSMTARLVRTIKLLCDDINSCEALIAKIADFGETRTPGVALISDPEYTFNFAEDDLPNEIIESLSEECSCKFDQTSAKKAISGMSTRLEFLLSSDKWASNEIDSEAYIRCDMLLQVMWGVWKDSAGHGPMPSYSLLSWVFMHDMTGK